MSKSNNSLLSLKNICKLIDIASKSNIKKLSFGDLHLEFEQVSQLVQGTLDLNQARFSEQEIEKVSKEVEAQNVADRLMQDLEELNLIDPVAYEKLRGELADGGTP